MAKRPPAPPKPRASRPKKQATAAVAPPQGASIQLSGAPIAWPLEMLWPLDRIKPWPGNAKIHPPEQITLLAAILLKRGPDQPIVVDDEGYILKGHGRRSAAAEAPLAVFPVVQRLGLSEVEKREIRLEDNAIPLLGSWDMQLLRADAGFLKANDVDLTRLGFRDVEVMQFEAGPGVNNPGAEWRGMPEFNQKDKTAFRSIVVHFKDQAAVDQFAAAIGAKITPDTRFAWYPEIEIETYADKRYAAVAAK